MSRHTIKKITFLLLVVAAGVAGYRLWGDQLSFEAVAARETELRAWQDRYPLLAAVVAFLIYVAVTGLSLPGATVLSIVYAWLFGLWTALVLVSFASTSGATVAFLLSRFFFREWIETRFGDRITKVTNKLESEGAFYLFTLRLIPQIPFFVVNIVMGLTRMKVLTFWWVSQLGMLAGTFVYVYAGSTIDLNRLAQDGLTGILTPKMISALVLLGVFPLATRKLLSIIRTSKSKKPDTSSDLESGQSNS